MNLTPNSLQSISIHAPAKGATFASMIRKSMEIEFQSTLPRRERRRVPCPFYRYHQISIHAPAKGATARFDFLKSLADEFQSTLPRRERPSRLISLPQNSEFQSTLPRRERLKSGMKVFMLSHFNPRSREGSDCIGAAVCNVVPKFQSTLPRRERHRHDGACYS